MNYTIVELEDGTFGVYEKNTRLIVENYSKYCDAKKVLREMNLGGSFDGWTPSFLAKKNKKICKKDRVSV